MPFSTLKCFDWKCLKSLQATSQQKNDLIWCLFGFASRDLYWGFCHLNCYFSPLLTSWRKALPWHRIKFHFDSNPYFENDVLCKEFKLGTTGLFLLPVSQRYDIFTNGLISQSLWNKVFSLLWGAFNGDMKIVEALDVIAGLPFISPFPFNTVSLISVVAVAVLLLA